MRNPPHDTTQMHKHSTPSVFLVLSNTKTGSQVLVEPGKPSFADGNIWFESFHPPAPSPTRSPRPTASSSSTRRLSVSIA